MVSDGHLAMVAVLEQGFGEEKLRRDLVQTDVEFHAYAYAQMVWDNLKPVWLAH